MPGGELAERRTAFMRYRGQGHEIAVALDGAALDPVALRQAFETTYARVFGRIIPGLEIEAVTWTLGLSQPYVLPAVDPVPPASVAAAARLTRRMIDTVTGEAVDAPVYARNGLRRGAALPGPAAITENGTTTIVPVGFSARIAHGGEIIIEGGRA